MLESDRSLANKALEKATRDAFFKAFGVDPLRNDPIQDVIASGKAEENAVAEEETLEFDEPEFVTQDVRIEDADNIFPENSGKPIFVSHGLDLQGKPNASVPRHKTPMPLTTHPPVMWRRVEEDEEPEQKQTPPQEPPEPQQALQQDSHPDPFDTPENHEGQVDQYLELLKNDRPVVPDENPQKPPRNPTPQPGKNDKGPKAPSFQKQSMPWALRHPGTFSIHPVDNSVTDQPATTEREVGLMSQQLADTSEMSAEMLVNAFSRIIDALLYLNSELEKHGAILHRSLGG